MPATPPPTLPPPDPATYARARARSDAGIKPVGAFGALEDLGAWMAACQGTCPPAPLDDVRVVVFAGDHGVAHHGVSAYPPQVTTTIVQAALTGKAGVNVLAAACGVAVRVLDIGCRHDAPAADAAALEFKVRRSSEPFHLRDALTDEEARQALAAGDTIAAQEIAGGAQLLIAGDIGIGNTTPSAALIAATYGLDAAAVTGRGTGVDDAGLAAKRALIQAGLDRLGDRAADPMQRLTALASADLAAAVGFLMGAAARGVPVLVDGVIATAEAVLAQSLQPGTAAWMRAGHRSPEPACALGQARLGLAPLVDLGMRLGEGTGAICAVPIVRAAVTALRDLAPLTELGPHAHPERLLPQRA